MKSKLLLVSFIVFTLILNACSKSDSVNPKSSRRKNLLYEETFESFWLFNNNYYSRNVNWSREIATPYGVTFVAPDENTKNIAARFELRKTDPIVAEGKRAELAGKPETKANRWYGMSINLPADYDTDSIPETIVQWHGTPDTDLGETGTNAPISLQTRNGQYILKVQWATSPVNDHKNIDGSKLFDLGPVDKNKWTNFVFHINYSHQSNGVVYVWRDGIKLVSYEGPNSYNDKSYPYFKFGIYKWGWDNDSNNSSVTKRVLYMDNIRIGDENASYEDVVPTVN
jgi:hypothetical protein